MIKQFLLIIVLVSIFVECKHSTPDFYTTEHGLKYKYHDINSDGVAPVRQDYLSVYNELVKKQLPLKQEETYYECVKRIAKESNVNIYQELGRCMSSKNTDDLNTGKKI